MTSAVPRSGWEATSSSIVPATSSSGMASRGVRMRPGFSARNFAP